MKPKVTVNCVANHYAMPSERIIEVSDRDTGKGLLISIRSGADGELLVEPYRCDDGVRIITPRAA